MIYSREEGATKGCPLFLFKLVVDINNGKEIFIKVTVVKGKNL